MTQEKVFAMSMSKLLDCYLAKAERKGRTKDETFEVLSRMTGYSADELSSISDITIKEFLDSAPKMNPYIENINGSICGVKIAEIENPLMKTIRRMDKIIDDLAKGKAIDRIIPLG